MGFLDKRQTARYLVEQPVDIVRDGTASRGTTINMSLGGLCLRADLSPPARVGDRVRLRFRVPTLEEPIEVDATVRWRNEVDTATIGVQFSTGLRAKQTFALGRYLTSLGPEATAP